MTKIVIFCFIESIEIDKKKGIGAELQVINELMTPTPIKDTRNNAQLVH